MTTPRLQHVQCLDSRGLHRMAYWEWGDAANPQVLVCVHGLSRQGRDFDTLAHSLADRYRVVCPDVVGRGQSDWLADPMGYAIPAYVADMVTLLARLNAQVVDWVGTSMGGLIGMGMAALKGSPVRRLVLNDVGPSLNAEGLARIGTYLGQVGHWKTLDEAADAMWQISHTFGPHTREQWMALSRHQVRPDDDPANLAGLKSHYDPAIAVPIRGITPQMAAAGEAMLWQTWDAIRARVLLLRGAQSDLLSAATAQAMCTRGPRATLVEFAGVGHAPTLIAPDQVEAVRAFLLAP